MKIGTKKNNLTIYSISDIPLNSTSITLNDGDPDTTTNIIQLVYGNGTSTLQTINFNQAYVIDRQIHIYNSVGYEIYLTFAGNIRPPNVYYPEGGIPLPDDSFITLHLHSYAGVWYVAAKPGNEGIYGLPGTDGDQGIEGDQGDTGVPGLDGPTGAEGDQGPPGQKGEVGDTGPQGDTGPSGEQGIPGIQGDTGA